MSKCGKGCMPECQYFTTGGCMSPFNCPYKIETGYINSATSTTDSLTGLLMEFDEMGLLRQYRAFDPEKYAIEEREKVRKEIERLKSENAELRATLSRMETVEKELKARLEKAIELPCIEPMTTWNRNEETGIMEEHFGDYYQLLYRDEEGEFICFPKLKKEEAEEQLQEIKEEKDE